MHMNEAELAEHIRNWLAAYATDRPVVVVPVFNAFDDVVECVASLLAHTPAEVPLLLVDDASTDERIAAHIPQQLGERGLYIRKPVNSGFVGSMNLAFAGTAPHDLVLVNSDVVVPARWLERLRAAAYSRTNIATATPLTNHGSILSVPQRDRPSGDLPNGLSVAEVDARIEAVSLKLRPVLPTAIGHCTYFKRSALDVVGFFDMLFAPGYGEEVDLSLRATSVGFCHVAADDVFVHHKGSRSFGGQDPERERIRAATQAAHEVLINERYPWYVLVRAEVTRTDTALALALDRACAALKGFSIAIDALCLHERVTGTIVLILELASALADALEAQKQTSGASPFQFATTLTLVVADQLPSHVLRGLDARVRLMTLTEVNAATESAPVFDLIHRPYQLTWAGDMAFLRRVARRCVVSQLDCIAYATPSYAANGAAWETYRGITERVFQHADGIVFISQDAAEDAIHRELHIDPARTCVTYMGVDHRVFAISEAELQVPAHPTGTFESPFLLVVGTNFLHKNRALAIRAFESLTRRYGWPGQLVLTGPHVAHGSSADLEAHEIEALPVAARERVQDLGPVNDAEKEWLLRHAAMLLFPSHYEGFGLPPFEAALHGTPALTGRTTSLVELLGADATYVEAMDADTWADAIWRMLSDPAHALQQVEAICARAPHYSWASTAERTLRFYERVFAWPARKTPMTPIATMTLIAPPPTRSWLQRLGMGLQVLKSQGWAGLRREINQYVAWVRR